MGGRFQSLEGIFGFFNKSVAFGGLGKILFQSLEGIFGFFNQIHGKRIPMQGVSIPRRDFWVFQHHTKAIRRKSQKFQSLEGIFGFFNSPVYIVVLGGDRVSIPRRDFWVFQRDASVVGVAGTHRFNP